MASFIICYVVEVSVRGRSDKETMERTRTFNCYTYSHRFGVYLYVRHCLCLATSLGTQCVGIVDILDACNG